MHPAREHERAVVEQVRGVGRVATFAALVEVLADGQIGVRRDELVEVRDRVLELDLEHAIADGAHAELGRRQLALVDRLAVLHGIEDERVLRRRGRIDGRAPREHEVVRRDGFAVAPERVLAQPERRAAVSISQRSATPGTRLPRSS